jgi:hypothetical protein
MSKLVDTIGAALIVMTVIYSFAFLLVVIK